MNARAAETCNARGCGAALLTERQVELGLCDPCAEGLFDALTAEPTEPDHELGGEAGGA